MLGSDEASVAEDRGALQRAATTRAFVRRTRVLPSRWNSRSWRTRRGSDFDSVMVTWQLVRF